MANKQDLIAKVAEATELTKKDSAAAVLRCLVHPRRGLLLFFLSRIVLPFL